MIVERSPGERSSAALVMSKKKVRASSTVERQLPEQRALGKVFSPEQAAFPGAISTAAIPGLTSEPITIALGELPEMANPYIADLLGAGAPPSFGAIPSTAPGIGGSFGSGGGGGNGGGGSSLPELAAPPTAMPIVDIPPSVSAVPEPQTWAMMLLGMATCAAAMRRRRALKAAQAVA
jgi:hypothetical protein